MVHVTIGSGNLYIVPKVTIYCGCDIYYFLVVNLYYFQIVNNIVTYIGIIAYYNAVTGNNYGRVFILLIYYLFSRKRVMYYPSGEGLVGSLTQ